MNFISKQIEQVDSDESKQCHINQAVICFKFHGNPSLDYMKLPLTIDQLDPWIFNTDTSKFTRPVITSYPNNSEYEIRKNIRIASRTSVGSVYSLLCDNIALLFQWRND